MKYKKLELFVSEERLDRYLYAANYSKTKAKQLYRVNIRVAQAFYPLLHLLEVFLRNSINYRIATYFSDPDWIINQKSGFMSDISLASSKYYLRTLVLQTEKSIVHRGKALNAGKVISEQPWSFWESFFDHQHYRLIGGVVIQCFPYKPSFVNRNTIIKKLSLIRKFRNRIYHNEPICFSINTINFDYAKEVHTEIFELLNWMDPELPRFVSYFDSIHRKISHASGI